MLLRRPSAFRPKCTSALTAQSCHSVHFPRAEVAVFIADIRSKSKTCLKPNSNNAGRSHPTASVCIEDLRTRKVQKIGEISFHTNRSGQRAACVRQHYISISETGSSRCLPESQLTRIRIHWRLRHDHSPTFSAPRIRTEWHGARPGRHLDQSNSPLATAHAPRHRCSRPPGHQRF